MVCKQAKRSAEAGGGGGGGGGVKSGGGGGGSMLPPSLPSVSCNVIEFLECLSTENAKVNQGDGDT